MGVKRIDEDARIPRIIFEEQGSDPASPPAAGHWFAYLKSDGLYLEMSDGTVIGPLGAGGGGGGAPDKGARVYNSSNLTTSDMADKKLTFDSERWDTDSMHSTVSNTSRLTVVTAGKYLLTGTAEFDYNAGAPSILRLSIKLNNSAFIARVAVDASLYSSTVLTVSTMYDLSAGDYVELVAYQNTGGALDILANGDYSPEFMAQLLA